MQDGTLKLLGLYYVEENKDVTLVELVIGKKAVEFDLGEFTQELEHMPRLNWQAPFGEKYLSLDGEIIIGDDSNLPKLLTDTTRLAFFFYFLDPSKSLLTPFGPLQLEGKQKQPARI